MDTDDWQLNPQIFKLIDELWGPHTLDCFASARTKQLERFCSRWWNPGCLAIDAFSVDWTTELVWLVPPLYLVSRVIDMLLYSKCHATLVVPKWQSAPWWPKLQPREHEKCLVKEMMFLPKHLDTFLPGMCPHNLFGGKEMLCEVVALRICTKDDCDC